MSALRSGITTGTCAAAAAQAAAGVLCGHPAPKQVELSLPDDRLLSVPVLYARGTDCGSMAAVRKDAGDDPDVTDGMEVVVSLTEIDAPVIEFVAGEGVGTVTKPGLQIAPGQPAINPVPREMITRAIRQITDRPLRVEVSIPGGDTAALSTFNPRLGIVGGLSVLGTTGIVRPYCRRAVQDTISCALNVAAACGVTAPVLVPGNIGAAAAREHFTPSEEQVVEVANQWGFALDQLTVRRFSAVMLLGHPGKLAKLAAGQWDTHSSHSESAAGLVGRIASQILPEPPQHSETVEGIFNSLSAEGRDRLGNEVARRVSAVVEQRTEIALPISTFLVNMAGERLGTNGDLTPWQ